jgi:pSer/pThr/pTyr-binding forkhead associated (FHA) protein
MALFIEIFAGTNEGSRYKIKHGITIGRSRADIVIEDPKASSTHAEVIEQGPNQLILKDLDSSNGLYINGRRVKKVALLPGVIFEVGRTQFKVIEVDQAEAEDLSCAAAWRDVISQLGSETTAEPPPEQGSLIQRFSPMIRLYFTQGIQSEKEVVLGYGPRLAGSRSLDIELLDPRAPDKAFELHPGPSMVELRSLSPRVLLNGQIVESKMLLDGDLISIGETVLRVSYY